MSHSSLAPDMTNLLGVFRIGLVTGLWDNQKIVAWADAQVLAEDAPSELVLDLALSGHRSRNDLVETLDTYLGDPLSSVSAQVILGILHQYYTTGVLPLERIVRTMDWLQWHGNLSPAEASSLAGVEDEYELAVAGIRGPIAPAMGVIDEQVRRVLSYYAPLSFDNQAAWSSLGPVIAGQVQAVYDEWIAHFRSLG
ncbi:MAG: hypothetical protein EOO60_00485 [Hymenobacter sp.]|nr:MAG: hypothetical protein EOO60_00485 [Hymenobacter sp.]